MSITKQNVSNVPKLRFKEFSGAWEEKKLGEIASIYDGTHQTPKYTASGVNFVSVENINNLKGSKKFISKEAFDRFKIRPQINDILMTRITAGIIGATSIIQDNNPLGYYVSLALIRLNGEDIDVSYLDKYINTYYFKNELHKRIIHVAFPKKINLGDINDCKTKFPQLPEQQKIASFLSSIDEKIESIKEKKEKIEKFKTGVMQKIFSQEMRFTDENGESFDDWEEKRLGDVGNVITGKTPSTSDRTLWDGDIQFITPSDILNGNKYQSNTNRYVRNTDKLYILPIGSIIYTCIASIGKMSLSVKPSITNQQINSIVPFKNTNNEYLYYYLLYLTPRIKSIQATTTLPIINKTDFSKFKIDLPSLPEQQKIADYLSGIDEKIEKVDEELKVVEEFKKGLLQKMFI